MCRAVARRPAASRRGFPSGGRRDRPPPSSLRYFNSTRMGLTVTTSIVFPVPCDRFSGMHSCRISTLPVGLERSKTSMVIVLGLPIPWAYSSNHCCNSALPPRGRTTRAEGLRASPGVSGSRTDERAETSPSISPPAPGSSPPAKITTNCAAPVSGSLDSGERPGTNRTVLSVPGLRGNGSSACRFRA